MEEQGNRAALQTYIRDCVLLSGTKSSGDVLSTCLLTYLSSTSLTHSDVLRFAIQPMNYMCWSVCSWNCFLLEIQPKIFKIYAGTSMKVKRCLCIDDKYIFD